MRRDEAPKHVTSCPRCGKVLFAYSSFCVSCGEDFDGEPLLPGGTSLSPESAVPVPNPHAGRAHRALQWEAVVGLVLFLLAMGWALFSWAQGTEQASAYHEGVAAERHKDWDKAVAGFQGAGGIQDSALRLSTARDNIRNRDALYISGMKALGRNDWAAALSSLADLQSVQPGYKDSEMRIAEARDHVYKQGLDGIIYLVRDRAVQGLYLRDKTGESHRVPNSDGESTVYAVAPGGSVFIYDQPGTEGDFLRPPLKRDSMVPDPFTPPHPARVPVVARLNSDGTWTTLPLPQLDSKGSGMFTGRGLWWWGGSGGPDGRTTYYQADYMDPASGVVPVSSNEPDMFLAALDARRSRVILTRSDGAWGKPDRGTYLYVAGADGSNPRLLLRVQGDVLQARVSEDGRWLLYLTQVLSADLVIQTAWVLPLERGTEGIGSYRPRQLQILSQRSFGKGSYLTAAFLPQAGDPLPKVIIDCVRDTVETVTVHDLADFAATRVWEGPHEVAYPYGVSRAGFSGSGSFLAFPELKDPVYSVRLVGLRQRMGLQATTTIPVDPDQTMRVQFPPGDHYVIAEQRVGDPGTARAVYAVTISRSGEIQEKSMKQIARVEPYAEAGLQSTALSYNGSIMTYINPSHELHAVWLDGSADTLLARDVASVWSLLERPDLQW